MNQKDKFKFLLELNHKALCILGASGTGKSAIVAEIAKEKGWNFIDIRMIGEDHAEANGYPFRTKTMLNGKDTDVMKKAIPEWAYLANQGKCIVCFDEFNRALKETMDGMLQVIYDRRIGYDFKFNDNVHFVLIGNLGEEDECDVNVFDRAVLGRMHIEKHNLTLKEWVDNFAKENVNSHIIEFLDKYPDYFYKINAKTDVYAYASPRNWHSLSKLIGGKDNMSIPNIMNLIENFGNGEIGYSSSLKFSEYLKEINVFNIYDVLDNFDVMKTKFKKMNRSKMNELIKELEKVEVGELNDTQYENLIKFLKIIDIDELTAYISYIVENKTELDDAAENVIEEKISDNVLKLLKEFKNIIIILKERNDSETETAEGNQ
jgi:molybdopterin-guanine dinucleotide biosynthesis protein